MLFAPAPAKLNLSLSVVSRRDDGRHELRSVVVHLDWHDLVGLEYLRDAPGEVEISVSGEAASEVPTAGNLVERAARGVLARRGDIGVRLHLDKRLPVAAGLGGGSADAATVLRMLATPVAEIPGDGWVYALAATLGSDVPACLAGGSLLVSGTGEKLERLSHRALDLVVAVAGRSSTTATFAALTPAEHHGPARPEALARCLVAGELPPSDLCGSDLEPAARRAHPELGTALDRLRAVSPGISWHMTGSGGAAFALAPDPAAAAELTAAVRAAGFAARRCRTVDAAPTVDPQR